MLLYIIFVEIIFINLVDVCVQGTMDSATEDLRTQPNLTWPLCGPTFIPSASEQENGRVSVTAAPRNVCVFLSYRVYVFYLYVCVIIMFLVVLYELIW